MTWDGAGNHDRIHNFSADASAGIQAQAARFDAEFDDISTALENCQTLTGETTPTANSPMGGFKHTGVAAATSTDNYLRADQSSNQVGIYVRDTNTGVTGVMSASAAVFPTAFTDGQRVTVKVSADGSTSAPRAIIINGLSANILDNKGNSFQSPLMFNDGVFDLVYDSSAGGFKMLNSSIPAKTVDITDAGGHFTGTELETVLAEVGSAEAVLTARSKSVVKTSTTWKANGSAPTSALVLDETLDLSLSVGATYHVVGQLRIQNASATSAGGIKFRFAQLGATPSGQYTFEDRQYGLTASASAGDLSRTGAHSWGDTISAGPNTTGGISIVDIKGIWPASASATRNIRLWWSPLTSAAASVGVTNWSYLKSEKI